MRGEAEVVGEAVWISSSEMDIHTVSDRVLSHTRVFATRGSRRF